MLGIAFNEIYHDCRKYTAYVYVNDTATNWGSTNTQANSVAKRILAT